MIDKVVRIVRAICVMYIVVTLDMLSKHIVPYLNMSYWFNLEIDRFGISLFVQCIVAVISIVGGLYVLTHFKSTQLRRFEIPFGLFAGGVIANMGSVLLGPPGVMDFIVAGPIIMNVADIGIFVGIAGIWSIVSWDAWQNYKISR